MNKKITLLVILCACVSALAMLRVLKSQPIERWDFRDKSGELVTIERITTLDDLLKNKQVYVESYADRYKGNESVLKTARESGKTLEEFLKFQFEDECKEFGKPNNYFVHAVRTGMSVGHMFFETTDDGQVFLRSITISPVCQGKGIGKELVRGIFKIRPDVTKAWLIVSRDNSGAVDFYKHLGFVESETLPESVAVRIGFDPSQLSAAVRAAWAILVLIV